MEYALDILTWRVDAFCFKTAEFCKRNWNRVRSTWFHLVYEVRKVKMGFVNLKNDVLFFMGVKRRSIKNKYS